MNIQIAQLAAVTAAKLAVSTSVSKVITNAVKTYVPAKNTFEHVQIVIGGAAIGSLVADAASKQVEDRIVSFIGLSEAIKAHLAEKDVEKDVEPENDTEESE